ncbi:arylsulfatase [Roseibacillus ishigakijimensis]|uniref:Arylsulfatase n=1 Tax=Roseibacillus ishigakijimensis TaxID=454146 RepID=A0A934VMV0_9BACT|nr:arylsulfatase [Roseibacillus ishigakijimensis]MBK1834481.1 arylsulfatase [Roseibacillus ishigakijimensis]
MITSLRSRSLPRALRVFALFCAANLTLSAAEKPNVVFVITDDQGYGDLSCHGNEILKTPELDELHGESVRLTDYHVSPTCAPTRGALMSGHFTNRAGPWHTIMGRCFLFEGEKTLGEVFQSGGYATGLFGKWHLGDNYPFRPEDRGFSEVVRHGAGGVGQAPDAWDNAYFDDSYVHNGELKKYEGYCTDVYFQEATRFINESVAADKPFFAYISTNAPHGPYHCEEKYWKPYLPELEEKFGKKAAELAVFFGMIANIDENVGKMRDFLEEKGLAENTIFIFTTDNGTARGVHVNNAGMKAGKGSPYDGGHRVPFFLHWPAGGFAEGRDVEELTAHIDVLPTFVELCELPPIEESYQLDGVSLVPLLKDEAGDWPERTIITDSQRVRDPKKWKSSSTMTLRWRLINGKELYDIQKDPGQRKNVAEQFPEVVAKLRADYEAWWEDISPVFENEARIQIGSPQENPTLLSSHDWLTNQRMVPWNHQQIRAGFEGTGFWALQVAEAGAYRITLHRWAPSTGAKITQALPAGEPVPGLVAFRETPGRAIPVQRATLKVASFQGEKKVSSEDAGITFEAELPAGEIELEATFHTSDDKAIGAYYVEVEKL